MILLDTNSLIWWVNRSGELSVAALARIEAERPEGEILVSAISAWEIAMLVRRHRLRLRMEPGAWLARIGEIPGITLVPVDCSVAVHSVQLPEPCPGGAAERMVMATARKFGCALVTADKKIQAYPHVQTVW